MPIVKPRDFKVVFGGRLEDIKDVYGSRINISLNEASFVTSIPDIFRSGPDLLGFQRDDLSTLAAVATIENYSKIGAVTQSMRAFRTGIISTRLPQVQEFVGDSVLEPLLGVSADLEGFVADRLSGLQREIGARVMDVLGPALPIISEAISAIPLAASYLRVASNVYRLIKDNWIDPNNRAPEVRCLRPWSGVIDSVEDERNANSILQRYALETAGDLNQFYLPAPGCGAIGGNAFGFTVLLINDEINGKVVDRGMRIEFGFDKQGGSDVMLGNTLPGLGKILGWDVMGRNFKRHYDDKTHTALGFDGPRHAFVPGSSPGDQVFDLTDRIPSVCQVGDQFWSGITLNAPSAFHVNTKLVSESWHKFFTTSPTQMLATGAEWCSLPESIRGTKGDPKDAMLCNMGDAGSAYFSKYNEDRLHTFIGPAANYLTRNFFPIILYRAQNSKLPSGEGFPYRCAAFDSFRSLAASESDPYFSDNVNGALAHGVGLEHFTKWLVGQIEGAPQEELQDTFFHPRIAGLRPGYWFSDRRYDVGSGLAALRDSISGLRPEGEGLHMRWTGPYGQASERDPLWYDQYPKGAYPPLPLLPSWMKSKRVTEWSFVSLYWWVKYLMETLERNQVAFTSSTTAAYLDPRLGAFRSVGGVGAMNGLYLNSLVVESKKRILQSPASFASIDTDMIMDPAFRQELVTRKAYQFSSGDTSSGSRVPEPQDIPGESVPGPTVGIGGDGDARRGGGSMMPLLLAGGAVLALGMMRKRR